MCDSSAEAIVLERNADDGDGKGRQFNVDLPPKRVFEDQELKTTVYKTI